MSGGCIVPHATYDFVNGPEDGYLIVQCWGKSIVGGGGVILENVGGANARISLVVGDTVWTAYRSADSLFCPAHQTLRIELDSGGIVYNAMLVDLIRVVRVW